MTANIFLRYFKKVGDPLYPWWPILPHSTLFRLRVLKNFNCVQLFKTNTQILIRAKQTSFHLKMDKPTTGPNLLRDYNNIYSISHDELEYMHIKSTKIMNTRCEGEAGKIV